MTAVCRRRREHLDLVLSVFLRRARRASPTPANECTMVRCSNWMHRDNATVKRRSLLFLVAFALVSCRPISCNRHREMVWTAERDGFEHSYFREPNGPVYVARKLTADGCIFREFPEDSLPTDRRVDCGVVWTGMFGHQLRCGCLDAGAARERARLDPCERSVIQALDLDACLAGLSRTCDTPVEAFDIVIRSDVRKRLGGTGGDCLARSTTPLAKFALLIETEGQPSRELVKLRAGVTTSPIPIDEIPTVMCGGCVGALRQAEAGWAGSLESPIR